MIIFSPDETHLHTFMEELHAASSFSSRLLRCRQNITNANEMIWDQHRLINVNCRSDTIHVVAHEGIFVSARFAIDVDHLVRVVVCEVGHSFLAFISERWNFATVFSCWKS